MTTNAFRIFLGHIWVFFSACQTVIPVADGVETAPNTSTTDTSSEVDGQIPGITSGILVHRWRFNEDWNDEVGESDAVIETPDGAVDGDVYLTDGEVYLTGGSTQAEWISLGTGLLTERGEEALSIELFATLWSASYFARIFEFGASSWERLFMSWTEENNVNSDKVSWWDVTEVSQFATNAPYTLGQEYHIVMTIDPDGGTDGMMRITWYSAPSDAADMGAAAGFLEHPDPLTGLQDIDCLLGKSHVSSDYIANASYDDVRIWSGALTQADIAELHRLGPDM
jgi:hypothetical protein